MIKYKLTSQNLTTYNGFQWEVGKKYTTSGEGGLCGLGWLHYYHHPLLAVLLNTVHANITHPRLFEVEAGGTHKDDNGLKGGCTEMTLIKEITLPEITTTQRVAFSILTSLEVYKDKGYREWAENWLSGKDRSRSAAESAARTAAESSARTAEWTAAWTATRSAAKVARTAAWTAESAAESAARTAAWTAAWTAALTVSWTAAAGTVAWTAAESAWTAAKAAEVVDAAAKAVDILNNLIKCAEKCLEY